MLNRFEGRRVIVTGAARGIGAAVALALHGEGASVVIGARNQTSLDTFLEQHPSDRFHGIAGDLSSREACHQFINESVKWLDGLDVLVNNAGIFADVGVADVTQTHWDETINVNLGGVFFCCQAALPALVATKGNIVNVASDAAMTAYTPAPTYCAAKGGVLSLNRTLAYEFAQSVRVNCVCPGNVATDMLVNTAAQTDDPNAYLAAANARSAMKRMATPEEIAQAIAYLASDAAGFTTGIAMPIDGGGMIGIE